MPAIGRICAGGIVIVIGFAAILQQVSSCGSQSPAANNSSDVATVASVDFDYDDQRAWRELPGSKCGPWNRRQSPININTYNVREMGWMRTWRQKQQLELNFGYLNNKLAGKLENHEGHTLQFNPNNKRMGLTIGRLSNKRRSTVHYLKQFHFHWGRGNRRGSEHRIDGKQYSGELHLVHQLRGARGTNGLLVVAVMLQNQRMRPRGTVWRPLMNNAPRKAGKTRRIRSRKFTFSNLLPFSKGYYHYKGSLTTPNCNPNVEWVVMKQPVNVPNAFFNALRTLKQKDGKKLRYNFRELQPLNGRWVYSSP